MSRIVRIHEYGSADVLSIDDVEVPTPAAGEVTIAVRSIGLNRAEIMFRNNAYIQQAVFPSRLGYEASGLVEAVGPGVTDFVIGEAVSLIPPLDIARWGTFGELANVPARNLVRNPPWLSHDDAAGVWMQYVTAWGALVHQAGLKSSDTLIVTAASSSVGLAAIQIARAVGATAIAATRGPDKRQALLAAGAHHVIVTDEEDLAARVMELTGGAGARVVFDPVAGPAVSDLVDGMATGGILLLYGALSSDPTPLPLFPVLSKSITIKGYLYKEIVARDDLLDLAKTFILDGLGSGTLKPVIARAFAFDEIREAQRFLESNEQIGKVIVRVRVGDGEASDAAMNGSAA